MLPQQWALLYGHPVHFAKTFVEPSRFAGTCYRAANWTVLGQTTGRGHNDRTNRVNRPRSEEDCLSRRCWCASVGSRR